MVNSLIIHEKESGGMHGKHLLQPQEIEVFYILPTIRKYLAVFMKEQGKKQSEIAGILGIQDATVSQYVSGKRGNQLVFDDKTQDEIQKAATRITSTQALFAETQRLLKFIRENNVLCEVHKKFSNVPAGCSIETTGCADTLHTQKHTPKKETREWQEIAFKTPFHSSAQQLVMIQPQDGGNTSTAMQEFEVDRSRYDDQTKHTSSFIAAPGLTKELVVDISTQKREPEWMLQKRLKGLDLFTKTALPRWGPPLANLDLSKIRYFVRPGTKEATSWDDVPEEIKKTFERIGIPEAERRALSGAGAQYDSDIIYHNLKKEWENKGVLFENMDTAVQKHPELVKQYFMTNCIPINDHKFIMLHAAVWSGGTFIYVPPGVKVTIPLQAYFRMNAEAGGQFEHTLIIADKNSEVHYIEGCSAPRLEASALHAGCVEIHVMEGAKVRYSSVENWSKNTFNLNTKRAIVQKSGTIEFVNGNLGSGTTMLYPCSVLVGEGARSDSLGIAFAGEGQNQDTGSKVIHAAPNTSSTIRAKSISKGGGISTYRGFVHVAKNATNTTCSVNCDALLIDPQSVSNTYPVMKVTTNKVDIAHEATVGKIGEEEIFYLMSRGITQEHAMQMIISGFIEPIVRQLPMEYAVELNKLIELEMEGSVG